MSGTFQTASGSNRIFKMNCLPINFEDGRKLPDQMVAKIRGSDPATKSPVPEIHSIKGSVAKLIRKSLEVCGHSWSGFSHKHFRIAFSIRRAYILRTQIYSQRLSNSKGSRELTCT